MNLKDLNILEVAAYLKERIGLSGQRWIVWI
jgi:hypothetical protein